MTYLRASKRQLELIRRLSAILDQPPPFWHEAYSSAEAARCIRKLLRLIKKQRELAQAEKQIKLI